MSSSTRRRERGIALFAVMFAILLLSVIGLGMMYSSNTESAINSNYKDAQIALYAAAGGLQEVRDRIQPATLSIVPPTRLPSLTAANVVYLINPKNGETVAPWDLNNTYRDTELCQENILGLTGPVGTPCDTLPSGSAWYATYNDSLTAAGVWRQTSPLDFKWVRVTLKKNNMTPVAANGSSTSSNQVCWDGAHQIMLPNGYGPECNRIGSVISVSVTNGGSNYTAPPTVTISAPPTGNQATAHANMTLVTSQMVQAVTVDNQGSGYTSAPTVTLSGGTGTGATAHVCTLGSECATPFVPLNGAPVDTITLGTAGTRCYATAPAISFNGGGGSGATAAATLAATNSCIQSVTYSGPCSAHKPSSGNPSGDTITGVGFSGGPAGSSDFSATLTFGGPNGEVTAMSIQNSGTGYTNAPTTITGISGCGSLTFTVNLGKRVQSVALTSGGGGYSSAPTVSFTTGTGTTQTDPTATTTLGAIPANAGKVTAVVVDNGGNGYSPGVGGVPTVTFASSSGTGAAATASVAPVGGTNYYRVSSITLDNQGYGYTTEPTVTFTAPDAGGVTAAADATLGRGANYGKVYLLTALAQTASGARAMMQMEAASPVTGFNATGALTIDGPNPNISNMPSSNNFYTRGNDANSCDDAETEPLRPAVGTYDDPNANPPTTSTSSVTSVLSTSPGPDHYVGEGGTTTTPSVQNVYSSLGETMGTPTGLKAMIDAINARKTNTSNTVLLGTEASPAINYITGDVTLNGSNTGYGILVVTGKLTMDGNFSWKGVVLCIGDGAFDFGGGGNGQITGTILVAKIWDNHTDQNLLSSLGSPRLNWNGGGGNGIQYDHCWATNMMSKIPFDAPPSTRPLKILSLRQLP